jgi:hypothetical protein
MKSKCRYITAVMLPVLLLSCGSIGKDHAFMSGTIEGGAGQTIYFEMLLPSGVVLIDSAVVDKKDNFTFYKKPREKSFYRLRLGSEQQTTGYAAPPNVFIMVTDSTERITVNLRASSFNTPQLLEGSSESLLLQEVINMAVQTNRKADSIQKLAGGSTLVPEAFNQLLEEQESFALNFIEKHQGKFVTLQALSLLNPSAFYNRQSPVRKISR